ncbi:MAG: helix-turn-helix domain-containing protein [Sneathiella sp.]
MKRPYELKQRAEARDHTRLKIVEAAIRLHQKQGIAATSMLDVATEAGVGKVTVYRHFPDLDAMTGACSGLYFERNLPPDPRSWSDIADPAERLYKGLHDTYAWFKMTKDMMNAVYSELRNKPLMVPYHDHWELLTETLLAPWVNVLNGDVKQMALLRAAIALALDFDTWRTLTQAHKLTDEDAADLMSRMISGNLPNAQ